MRNLLPGPGPALALLLLVPGLTGGCVRVIDPASEQEASEATVDELRALPYSAFTGEKADTTKMGVMYHDEQRSYPGYNLYTLWKRCESYLVDMGGAPVARWSYSPCAVWLMTELLPDGNILVVGREPGSRYLIKFDFAGRILWKRPVAVHHDVELTPRNQLLSLTVERRPVEWQGKTVDIRDNALALFDTSGEMLEAKSLYELFSAQEEQVLDWVRPRKKGKAADLFHGNSVEWMRQAALFGTHPIYGESHVLISLRHQDMVAIFDWDTDRLVWWWGKGELAGPHDATLLEDGNILIFDNGLGRKYSRLVEVDPRRNEIVWEFRSDTDDGKFYSAILGAAQRLPNGNTLAANSMAGQGFEVTPDGRIVWDYYVPLLTKKKRRAPMVRIKRYEPERIEPLLPRLQQAAATD